MQAQCTPSGLSLRDKFFTKFAWQTQMDADPAALSAARPFPQGITFFLMLMLGGLGISMLPLASHSTRYAPAQPMAGVWA